MAGRYRNVEYLRQFRRAGSVTLFVGLLQLAGITAGSQLTFGETDSAQVSSMQSIAGALSGWRTTFATVGFVYVVTSLAVFARIRPGVWVAMIAALAQTLVLGLLALLSVLAGVQAGSPGTMTLGVVCFGTMAALHVYVLRALWVVR